MPERVEELAPEQAAASPAIAVADAAPAFSMPAGGFGGGLSAAQVLHMQQGAGNAAVSSYLRGRRPSGANGGGDATVASNGTRPSALTELANGTTSAAPTATTASR